ncbi:XPA protein C-terminus-domain-containing protein, partial [Melampsora americana]
YVDYDLSTLKNSKGGFLLNSEEDNQKLLKQNQQIQELKNQRLNQIQKFHQNQLSTDPNDNPKCKVCSSIELDLQIYHAFRVPVCKTCKNNHPDRFSLLTKTECKEDYLLTDPELKDTELLPHLLKANPHQSTYSNMMLYLREQVEGYAFSNQKWGSSENLDQEFQRRSQLKKQKKSKQFEQNLKTLRNQTRKNLYQKRQDELHSHEFNLIPSVDGSTSVQKCITCGLETE